MLTIRGGRGIMNGKKNGENRMKILCFNAGPKKQGATTEILRLFQETIRGHEVEMICLGEKEIHYCQGCKTCYSTRNCV